MWRTVFRYRAQPLNISTLKKEKRWDRPKTDRLERSTTWNIENAGKVQTRSSRKCDFGFGSLRPRLQQFAISENDKYCLATQSVDDGKLFVPHRPSSETTDVQRFFLEFWIFLFAKIWPIPGRTEHLPSSIERVYSIIFFFFYKPNTPSIGRILKMISDTWLSSNFRVIRPWLAAFRDESLCALRYMFGRRSDGYTIKGAIIMPKKFFFYKKRRIRAFL